VIAELLVSFLVWRCELSRPDGQTVFDSIVRRVLCWLCVERGGGGGRSGSPGTATHAKHAKQAARPSRPAAQTYKYATIACELITAEQ